MPISELDDAELVRLYGPWAGRRPSDAAELLSGYPGRWWIAGGWAIKAFTGIERLHADLDLEVLRTELPLLRQHLAGRLDVWTAAGGALRPLLPHDDASGPSDVVLPAGCGQVWVRAAGQEPWEYGILLAPGGGDQWEFKRDRRITRPIEEVLWRHDGVHYLRPELQLLLKAKGSTSQGSAGLRCCYAAAGHGCCGVVAGVAGERFIPDTPGSRPLRLRCEARRAGAPRCVASWDAPVRTGRKSDARSGAWAVAFLGRPWSRCQTCRFPLTAMCAVSGPGTPGDLSPQRPDGCVRRASELSVSACPR